MRLREIKFSDIQEEFYTRTRQIGVVLDICLLEFDEMEASFEISKNATVESMQIFAKRYLEKLIAVNPGRDVSKYFQIRINENIEPKGVKINYEEFLGTGFDFDNNRVDLFSYSENCKSTNIFDGLIHALLDPPYGISLMPAGSKLSIENGWEEQQRMTELLFEFLEKMLNINKFADFENYKIHSCSDDWSNYFNAGKDWWGAFYWTLLHCKNKTITVIGASQTD